MIWKTLSMELLRLTFPAALCGAAFWVHAHAWRRGYSEPEMGILVGCLALSFIVLGLAWLSLCVMFATEANKDRPFGVKVSATIILFMSAIGCLGCYPFWPIILLLAIVTLLLITFRRRDTAHSPPRLVVARAIAAAL